MNLDTAQYIWEKEAIAHGYQSFIIVEKNGIIGRIFCKDPEDHTISLEAIDVTDTILISEVWV